VEYAKLETATLAHVDDRYYYGAYCRKCKHAARLSLVKLRANLGDNFLVSKIRQRLRCERCKSRAVVITFLAPDQRGGSVTHLLESLCGGRPTYGPRDCSMSLICIATSGKAYGLGT
jgi:hypothetical protein